MRRMRQVFLVLVSAGLFAGLGFAAGCGDSDDDECGSDSDCKGDRICEGGDCVDPNDGGSGGSSGGSGGSTDECSSSSDCEEVQCQCADGTVVDFQGCDEVNGVGTCATEETCADDPYNACEEYGGGGTDGGSSGGSTDGGGSSGKELGSSCNLDSDCASDFCYEPDFEIEGYCSKGCTDWTECPDGVDWDCVDVDDHPNTICVKD